MRISALLILTAGAIFAAPKPATVTFYKDVLPILQDRCQSCHRPGEIGPMPLLNYTQARPWAAAIKQAVASKKMPPWFSETPSQHFKNDASLTPEQIQTVLAWANSGAKEGNPQDARPNPTFVDGWNIGQPDLVVSLPKPYSVPAKGTVDYTYIVIPGKFDRDVWIDGAELRADHREVTHHLQAFIRPPGSQWLRNYPTNEFFVPKEQFSKPGVKHPAASTNAGASPFTEPTIAGYVPGYLAERLPAGHAIRIPAGSDVVFQLHYTARGKELEDVPRLGFTFAKQAPERQLLTIGPFNDTFVIPPGEANFEVKGTFRIVADCDLLSAAPHMHYRGKSMLIKAVYPTGESEVLLNVPHYDFNWQQSYDFAAPKHLPRGTILEADAVFDNSVNNPNNPDPKSEVRWGDQSWNEMMVGFVGISMPRPKPSGPATATSGSN